MFFYWVRIFWLFLLLWLLRVLRTFFDAWNVALIVLNCLLLLRHRRLGRLERLLLLGILSQLKGALDLRLLGRGTLGARFVFSRLGVLAI